jgi:hypothetical protein
VRGRRRIAPWLEKCLLTREKGTQLAHHYIYTPALTQPSQQYKMLMLE